MKRLVPFITAIVLFPILVLANNNEYLSIGSEVPNNWVKEQNPVCEDFVNQSKNLVKTARNVYLENKKIAFFFYDGDILTGVDVKPSEIEGLIANLYEALEAEEKQGYLHTGAVISANGNQWLAVAVPDSSSIGCHYIPLKELPEPIELAGQ